MKHFQELKNQFTTEFVGLKQQLYLEEIAKEWDAICFQYRLKLDKPCFRLTEGSSTLGSWTPESRTLSLAFEAVEKLCWDSVISLLKHEVAHQIVSEVYFESDMHGPKFQIACDKIGLFNLFRRANLSLDDVYESQTRKSSLPSPLSRKLEKLQALSRSDNVNEAQLALQRLQELKHMLAEKGLHDDCKDRFLKLVISLGKKKVNKVHSLAAQILATYFGVEVIYSSEYHVKRLERTKTLVLMGRAPLVEMAEYVFHFVCDEVERLWQVHKRSTGAGIELSSSFKIGVMKGFESTLGIRERRLVVQDSKNCESKAILAQQHSNEKRALGEFVASQFPRLSRQYSQHKVFSSAAHSAGQEAGRRIALRKPFAGQSSQQLISGSTRSSDI